MITDYNALREYYRALSDDELQNLVMTGGLTEEARELLNLELGRRGIQDVSEYREHLERYDADHREKRQRALERQEKRIRLERRLGYGLALIGMLVGL